MRPLSALALLAASAAAIDDLSPCQSRCYDQTADLVGCGADDHECACSSWDSRFAPQFSSCMIEGCAFGDESSTMDTKELKEKVCGSAGQSPAPSSRSEEAPTGDSSSTEVPSQTTGASSSSSQDSGETAKPTSQGPDETSASKPEPTDDEDDGDDKDGDESGARLLSVGAAVFVPFLGYLVL